MAPVLTPEPTGHPSPARPALIEFFALRHRRLFACGIAAAAFHVTAPTGWHDSQVRFIIIRAIGTLALLAAIRCNIDRDARRPWMLIGAGFVVGSVADVVEYASTTNESIPFPGPADYFYVAYYIPLVVGLLLLVRQRNTTRDRRADVDAGIAALGAAFVVLGLPGWLTIKDAAGYDIATAVGYPLLDILLVGFLIRLAISPGTAGPTLNIIIVAVAFEVFSDARYGLSGLSGSYEPGTWDDLGFILSPWLWAAAIWHPRIRELAEPDMSPRAPYSMPRVGILIIGSVSVPGVLIADALRPSPLGLGWFSGAITILVVLVSVRAVQVVAEIRNAANTDAGTGLLARQGAERELHDRVTRTLPRATALWVLDVTSMGHVVESYGWTAADELANHVTRVLYDKAGPWDLIARWEPQRFLMSRPAVDELTRTTHELRNAFDQPFDIAGHPYHPTVDVHEIVFTNATDDLAQLITNAGRTPSTNPTGPTETRAEQTGGFRIRFSRVVELGTGRIAGLNAVPIWENEKNQVAPDEVVDLAVRVGLEEEMTLALLRTTGEVLAGNPADTPPWINVRVSWSMLDRATVAEEVLAISAATGHRIRIVVPESPDDQEHRYGTLERLTRRGVNSVLRFSGGPISLRLLAHQGPCAVSVGQHLSARLDLGPDEPLIKTITTTAKAMERPLIAEGLVGSRQRLNAVAAGFTYGTGPIFGPTIGPDDVAEHWQDGPGWLTDAGQPQSR